jgi:hypothetical protein
MERIEAANAAVRLVAPQLAESNALSLRREKQRLEDAELATFHTLMEQMWAYYPNQEFAVDTVEGYQFDLERLAAIHGLEALWTVLLALRIRAGQRFFPHPSEVTEALEAMAKKGRDEMRAENPYVPQPGCNHISSDGMAWVIDKAGDRVLGRCECWKRWKGQLTTTARDAKAAAAGEKVL